jgi:LacI family transcriptional regulator
MAVTRDDVARAAGVSNAVVSYVLNDGPRPVAQATRARVLAAIAELGYRRDGLARSLRTGVTHSIGFVLPDVTVSYFATMMQHITETASAHGYQVLVGTSGWDLQAEQRELAELAERRVGGIILMSVDPDRDLSALRGLGVPVLVVDRPEAAVASARAATEHLLAVHGCKRIAYIAGPAQNTTAQRRIDGWMNAIAARMGAERGPICHEVLTREGGYRAGMSLLPDLAAGDGLVVDTTAQAEGFLRAAHECGVKVPDELPLITYEGLDGWSAYGTPALTTIDSPIDEIAAEAVEIITQATPADRLLTLTRHDFALIARESCGCTTHVISAMKANSAPSPRSASRQEARER